MKNLFSRMKNALTNITGILILLSFLALIVYIIGEPFWDRKYYCISKEQLEKMEKRIVKMQGLIDDAKYDVSTYSDTYDTLEELEEDADKLLNYVSQVYDDEANN